MTGKIEGGQPLEPSPYVKPELPTQMTPLPSFPDSPSTYASPLSDRTAYPILEDLHRAELFLMVVDQSFENDRATLKSMTPAFFEAAMKQDPVKGQKLKELASSQLPFFQEHAPETALYLKGKASSSAPQITPRDIRSDEEYAELHPETPFDNPQDALRFLGQLQDEDYLSEDESLESALLASTSTSSERLNIQEDNHLSDYSYEHSDLYESVKKYQNDPHALIKFLDESYLIDFDDDTSAAKMDKIVEVKEIISALNPSILNSIFEKHPDYKLEIQSKLLKFRKFIPQETMHVLDPYIYLPTQKEKTQDAAIKVYNFLKSFISNLFPAQTMPPASLPVPTTDTKRKREPSSTDFLEDNLEPAKRRRVETSLENTSPPFLVKKNMLHSLEWLAERINLDVEDKTTLEEIKQGKVVPEMQKEQLVDALLKGSTAPYKKALYDLLSDKLVGEEMVKQIKAEMDDVLLRSYLPPE